MQEEKSKGTACLAGCVHIQWKAALSVCVVKMKWGIGWKYFSRGSEAAAATSSRSSYISVSPRRAPEDDVRPGSTMTPARSSWSPAASVVVGVQFVCCFILLRRHHNHRGSSCLHFFFFFCRRAADSSVLLSRLASQPPRELIIMTPGVQSSISILSP